MPGSFSPIAETQIGAIAYLFGITNNGSPVSITGIVSFELDSDDVTSTWDEKANKDTTGNIQNFTQTNFRYERGLKFNPSGASRAAAAAVADAVMTLQLLVVANYKVNTFNGSWRVRPGTQCSLKIDDNASISMQAERYLNSAQNTALTSTPIAG